MRYASGIFRQKVPEENQEIVPERTEVKSWKTQSTAGRETVAVRPESDPGHRPCDSVVTFRIL